MGWTILINILSVLALSGYLAYIYNHTPRTELLFYYAWMHLFAVLVLISQLLSYLAPEFETKYVMTLISSIINLYFSVAFYCFSQFYYRKKHMRPYILILLHTLPLIGLILVLLSPRELFLKASPTDQFGILYNLYCVLGYILQFLGCTLMILNLTKGIKTSLFKIMIVGISLLAFSFKFMMAISSPNNWIIIHPILVFMIFTLLYVGAVKLGLFNTMSLGVRRSLELYSEAIFVIDKQGKLTYSNLAFQELNPSIGNLIVKRFKLDVDKIHTASWEEQFTEAVFEDRIFTLSIRPLKTVFNQITGFICIIHDDTLLKATLQDLRIKNEELTEMNQSIKKLEEQAKKLAVMEERNILAKEIHDVLGHSLILALHTLESNKLILNDNPEQAILRLKQVLVDIDGGMVEIAAANASILVQHKSESTLMTELADMSSRLEEVGVKFEVMHSESIRNYSDLITKTVYRICQEACTNAIKHGKANCITASFMGKDQSLYIHIIDNGLGCTEFSKGNGLHGMEERVYGLGGSIRFSFFEDSNGFMIHAIIPVN